MSAGAEYQRELIGVGYTLATGRLFCDVNRFHAHAEAIMGRPVLTHEFADEDTWTELRERFEAAVIEHATPS